LANAVARRLIDKGYTLRKYSLNNKAWYWVYWTCQLVPVWNQKLKWKTKN